MTDRIIRVFLTLRHVNGGVRAEWIARRTSSLMYRSKKCSTDAEAIALAHKWIRRPSNVCIIDTTNYEAHPSWRPSSGPTVKVLAPSIGGAAS